MNITRRKFLYEVGDEFCDKQSLTRYRADVMEIIKQNHGQDCQVIDAHEDTTMDAVGSLVPARRRRVFYLEAVPNAQG